MDECKDSQEKNLSILDQFPKKRKGKKRVTFPPDEDMVSDFVEHLETQRPVYNVTLKEVTSAYKRRCLKHEVDPKSKVLKQIEEGTAEWSHPKQLDLQGERLDYHSCESLEDILKLLQFDFINLRETQLEENGASSLLDMILYYESTTHLDISSNTNIGIWGWQSLSHLIQQSRCLRRLDVSNMPLLDDTARMLSGALLCSRLTVLCLENSCLSGRPLFTLVGTLKKNTSLQELCLANNKLNSFQDSMQLGDLLKHNHCLQLLDLSNNLISDPGLEEICEGLRAQKGNLRTLLLCGNYLTEQGMVHLATVLPGIKMLETLNLGNNNLRNQGVQTLKDSLIANCSLQQLCLACTQITCEGVVALAEFIAESRKIQQLDIRENLVGTGGLMALSLALKINHSLVRVDLDHKPKENEEEFLIAMQKNLLGVISDRCRDNASGIESTPSQPGHPPSNSNAINPALSDPRNTPDHINHISSAAPEQENPPSNARNDSTDIPKPSSPACHDSDFRPVMSAAQTAGLEHAVDVIMLP